VIDSPGSSAATTTLLCPAQLHRGVTVIAQVVECLESYGATPINEQESGRPAVADTASARELLLHRVSRMVRTTWLRDGDDLIIRAPFPQYSAEHFATRQRGDS
jgi:hypothetical protein